MAQAAQNKIIIPDELRHLQVERLNQTLRRAAAAPFYREQFARTGRAAISDPAELAELPFTTKDDLRNNFPYGFLAVPREQLVRLHSSSGTTGNPTVIYHTARDIAAWAELVARNLEMTGVGPGDVLQNTMGYGLFTGGLGFHYGAEKRGVLTIPIGPGNSRRQIWFMQKFGTTVLHILPSYALRLHSHFTECGVDPRRDLKLRLAFIGAEPCSDELRRQIESLYGIKVYSCYGMSEMCGPGIAFECPAQNGLHLWEDFVYPEIIDPVSGAVLPDGAEGELVLTTLTREANPLIRYRTRDLTRFLPGPCPCGRSHRRLALIKGRSDDMLIINGVNLFPVQIEQTIMQIPQVGSNYLIEIHTERFMDRLVVKVEMRTEFFSDNFHDLEHLQQRIAAELKNELGVAASVKLVAHGSLPAPEGKAQRVCDRRGAAAVN